MSLISRLERLEKNIGNGEQDLGLSQELAEELGRIITEASNRPQQTIQEQMAWLRETIKQNETIEEPWKFMDEWARAELVRLEAEVAKLQ